MESPHLRLRLLEYVRITEKASTRICLRVDRYMGEDRQAHLLSLFGNDSDVGAIMAAVHEKATFGLAFPDGTTKDVTLGEHASCYKGAVALPGRKHPVRHLLAVSEELHTNGTAGRTFLLRYRREEAWATLASLGFSDYGRDAGVDRRRPAIRCFELSRKDRPGSLAALCAGRVSAASLKDAIRSVAIRFEVLSRLARGRAAVVVRPFSPPASATIPGAVIPTTQL